MARNGLAIWLKTLFCFACFPTLFCLESSNSSLQAALKSYSIVHLRNSNQTNDDDLFQRSFCLVNFENESNNNMTSNVYKSFYNFNSQNLCKFSTPTENYDLNAYYLFHYTNSCTIEDQIEKFSDFFEATYQPSGVLFSTPCDVNIKAKFNLSKQFVSKFNFLISVINDDKASNFDHNNQLKVVFPEHNIKFPTPLIGIFVIAIFTVCIGSYWSGLVRFEIYLQSKLGSGSKSISSDEVTKGKSKIYQEQAFTNISILTVVVLVCCMVTALLLLYFFYKYLVYFILFLFLFTSMTSIYLCLASYARAYFPRCILQPAIKFNCTCYCLKPFRLLAIDMIIISLSIAVPIYWFVMRHTSSFAWLLQDIMGVFFCINMLRTLRLPSFKICVILELILFVYDIFFVFITPLFTSKGQSIMVEVATGGSGSSEYNYLVYRCEGKPVEALPMLFRVPRLVFGNDPYDLISVCSPKMDSMLGFGDVMIPGLLIAYCAAFDRIRNIPKHLYFIISMISYGTGLIITFAALYLMRGAAQPALLYLVPCTLLPVFLLSLYRREFRPFWLGPEKNISLGSRNNPENSNELLDDDNINQS